MTQMIFTCEVWDSNREDLTQMFDLSGETLANGIRRTLLPPDLAFKVRRAVLAAFDEPLHWMKRKQIKWKGEMLWLYLTWEPWDGSEFSHQFVTISQGEGDSEIAFADYDFFILWDDAGCSDSTFNIVSDMLSRIGQYSRISVAEVAGFLEELYGIDYGG